VNMPLLDGRDLCRAIKQREDTRDMIVLFLSARADQFSRRVCLELGAEDFVEKPFDLDGLMRKVKYVLAKHRRA
jgi:DNA-binding response OmpR family regulator